MPWLTLYQCYGSHCKKHNSSYFSCNIVKSETTTNLTILFIPPEIKVEDKRANKFHCRQNITFSNGIDSIRFTIHRHDRNTGKTQVLDKGDFDLVTGNKEQGFQTQTFSERLFSSNSEVCIRQVKNITYQLYSELAERFWSWLGQRINFILIFRHEIGKHFLCSFSFSNHVQSVPPKRGQLRTHFFFSRKHICQKIRPVKKILWKKSFIWHLET